MDQEEKANEGSIEPNSKNINILYYFKVTTTLRGSSETLIT